MRLPAPSESGRRRRRPSVPRWARPTGNTPMHEKARMGVSGPTPEKTTATVPPRGGRARRGVSRPARPAVPVADTGMPVAVPISWACTIAASGTTTARPPERLTTSKHTEPVVRLVIEDPVGGGVRVGPRRHQLRPVGGGRSSMPPRASRNGASARARGAHPSALHGVDPDAGAQSPPCARRQRSAADLYDHAVEAGTGASAWKTRSCGRRRGTALFGPRTPNGSATGGHGLAGSAGRPGHRADRSSAARTGGSPPRATRGFRARTATPTSGTNTSIGQNARRASVAAAIAGLPHEAMASGRRWPGAAQRFGGDEVQQDRLRDGAPCGSRRRCPSRP